MKKLTILLTALVLGVVTLSAQQAANASVKQTTPVMKAEAKPAAADAVSASGHDETKACCKKNAAEGKACCKDKASSGGHGAEAKSCGKGGEAKACCKKDGKAQACNHGAVEKEAEKKPQ